MLKLTGGVLGVAGSLLAAYSYVVPNSAVSQYMLVWQAMYLVGLFLILFAKWKGQKVG